MFRQLVWLTTPKKFCTKEIGFGPHLKSQKYQTKCQIMYSLIEVVRNLFCDQIFIYNLESNEDNHLAQIEWKNYFHL